MQAVDVTPRVWGRLLAARAGSTCLCCGDWSPGEERALRLYGPLAQSKSDPHVIAQIGQSLDGRIATVSGDAQDVSGQDGLAHLHRLRALVDAVVIGVKTALHDDPRLTVRLAEGQNPARVVIDPGGRLPNDITLLRDASARRVVIQAVDKARPSGVEVVQLPRETWIAPGKILRALGALGLNQVLIEGGGITIAQFLEAGLLSRLHVAVAPLLIGAGPQGLTTAPVSSLAEALRPKSDVYGLGSDVLFDCALRPCEVQQGHMDHPEALVTSLAPMGPSWQAPSSARSPAVPPETCLLPTMAERLSRARSDLRLGLPCLVRDGGERRAIVAIEPMGQERLDALRALFGTPELVLTANRARAVMPHPQGFDVVGDPVRIQPPEQAEIGWFRRLADTAFDGKSGPTGPLHLLRRGRVEMQSFALTLVKSAELLPAALVFRLSPDAAIPQGLSPTEIDLAEAEAHLAHAPVLSAVASAGLPVEAHETGHLHIFRDPDGITEHYALEIGCPDRQSPVLSRLHSACFTGDVLGSLKCDCGPQLRAAMARMGQEGAGVLLYLNQEGRGIGLANKMRVYDLQSQGFDTVEANHQLGFADDERDFRVAAVMLRTLGFGAVRLLTNNPAKVQSFRAQGVDVVDQLPLRVGENPYNSAYLAVKALKSGHAL